MTATNFRDLLAGWLSGDPRFGPVPGDYADADDILALPAIDCPTCKGHGRVGCPGRHDRAHTQMERDALGRRKSINYYYEMHMGHPCPTCTGTGKATVAQLLAWGQAVATNDPGSDDPEYPEDADTYRNRILGVTL